MVYVEGFECGLCTPSGEPIAYINRAILRDDEAIGTVFGKIVSVGTGETYDTVIDRFNTLPFSEFVSAYTDTCIFYKYENFFLIMSPPLGLTSGLFASYGYEVNTGTQYTGSLNRISTFGNNLVLEYGGEHNLGITLCNDNNVISTYIVGGLAFNGEYTDLTSSNPDEVLPIPPSSTELEKPRTVRFGLILHWIDHDITVDDYNVNSRGIDFTYDQLGILSYYAGSVIKIPIDYNLDSLRVRISHNVYDLWADATYGVILSEEPGVYDPGGVQGPSGGNGTFDDGDSDDIRQLIPPGSAGPDTSNLGLYTRYLMTASQIQDFGDYLYADNLVESITNGIMKALFDSPAEAVISLMHYPFDVSSLVSSSGGTIWYGNLNTGKSSSGIMNNSSARIEWGTIALSEFWGNFLDYAPHTKIDLYLPWCVGSVPIDPHECLPGTLEVITNIEFDKGTCIHSVIGNKNAVIGTYSGVVGTQIPVTALDSSGKALAFVTAAVAGAVSAGATGAATSAGIRAANSWQTTAATVGMSLSERNRFTENVIRQAEAPYRSVARGARNTALASSAAAFRVPPNITRNGSFSGNGASLGVQVPYIILSRPTQSVPQNYGRYYGYPSNIYSSLGSLSGYTEVGSIHLDGFSCTVDERNEIEELLTGGVIL